MLSVPALLCALSAAVVSVSAHGYVQQVLVDGVYYTGYLPYQDPYHPSPARIVRPVPGNGPIINVTSPDMACGRGGETGTHTAVANVNAGSEITFLWTAWPASHRGPVSTYMASCNGPCSSFSTLNAKWFKIDASGYENNEWGTTKFIAANNTWTTIIPAGLASGQYLIRNEPVALHFVGKPGGLPQFYPSCTQLNVVNGGSDTPAPSELVDITELYNGIQWPDVWLATFNSFTIPGPNVVSFSTGQDTGTGLNSSHLVSPPSSSSFSPSSTGSHYPASSPSGSCRANGMSNRDSRHAHRMVHRRSSA